MKRVNIADAKAHLSEYIREVKKGETLVICERNVPVAEVTAYKHDAPKNRRLGIFDGQMEIPDDAFAPMSDEEVADIEDDPRNPLNWHETPA